MNYSGLQNAKETNLVVVFRKLKTGLCGFHDLIFLS